MKLKLTADQAKDLPFPIGCPVWYNASEKQAKEVRPTLKRGVIESAFFNYGARDMVYEVVYKDDEKGAIVEEVSEQSLAYGSSCPVTVVSSDSNEDRSCDEGTILLSEPSSVDPGKFVYTVMIMMEGSHARFERGVSALRIKYRTVKRNLVNADIAETAATSSTAENKPSSINNDPPTTQISGSASAARQFEGEVPSSITCDSVAKSVCGSSKRKHMDTALQVDTRAPINDDANYKQDSKRSLSNYSHRGDVASCPRGMGKNENDTQMMLLKTPHWLQRDAQTQRELFFHLIGSKRHGELGKRTVYDVQRESNCNIEVNFENTPPRRRDNIHIPAAPISLTVKARYRETALLDLDHARKKLQELLLDYMNVIRDEGSKERLFYEVALSCEGDHRPRGSTSHAVRASNGSFGNFMSIVELPYAAKNVYHGGYLLHLPVLVAVKRRKCRIRVCGDDFRIPLKLCNPHVVVSGFSWQDVDSAADVVKDAIRSHMRQCSCHF